MHQSSSRKEKNGNLEDFLASKIIAVVKRGSWYSSKWFLTLNTDGEFMRWYTWYWVPMQFISLSPPQVSRSKAHTFSIFWK